MSAAVLPRHASGTFGAAALESIEALFDRAFGARCNPWRHLGALSFFLFWLVAASGIGVYVLFDTSVQGAFDSVKTMTREQPYTGGLLRSVHRYASDAFLVITLLHLLREWLRGRFRHFRWFSWVSGVVLLWLVYASGIGGYWLVWDQLAQFSLVATMEWFDALPLFPEPLARTFLVSGGVDDRFLSLLMFLHIGIPLLLLAGMWWHIQRISWAHTMPPRAIGIGTLVALIVLSLAWPARSHEIAAFAGVPIVLRLDWFYLFIHPVMYVSSPSLLWLGVAGATALFLALPWWRAGPPLPVARVDLDNCNGCARCVADCPYAAVVMGPRTDRRPHPTQAIVLTDLCAGCGICAGACPSSTPFRSTERLVTGIDVPTLPVDRLRTALEAALAERDANDLIVVFGCDHAVDVHALADARTIVFSLICTGMLPPSFIEYALRGGAAGVFITGCIEGDCAYRLGNRWVEERLRGEREPHLRSSVPRDRVRARWFGRRNAASLQADVEAFRAALAGVTPPPARRARSLHEVKR